MTAAKEREKRAVETRVISEYWVPCKVIVTEDSRPIAGYLRPDVRHAVAPDALILTPGVYCEVYAGQFRLVPTAHVTIDGVALSIRDQLGKRPLPPVPPPPPKAKRPPPVPPPPPPKAKP
jgi:hypothetical protein